MGECMKAGIRIFKNAWFTRFARKEGISDRTLLDAIERAGKGLVDADLGGGVIKLRLARPGQGKSSGHRSIVLYRAADRAFFVYGFAKNDRANIDKGEEAAFKKMATHVLGLSQAHLDALIAQGQFTEISAHGEDD